MYEDKKPRTPNATINCIKGERFLNLGSESRQRHHIEVNDAKNLTVSNQTSEQTVEIMKSARKETIITPDGQIVSTDVEDFTPLMNGRSTNLNTNHMHYGKTKFSLAKRAEFAPSVLSSPNSPQNF